MITTHFCPFIYMLTLLKKIAFQAGFLAAMALGLKALPTFAAPTDMPSSSGQAGVPIVDPTAPTRGFNYVLGTETFHPAYHFTQKPRLVETAEAIQALGATVIKFEMSRRYAGPTGNTTNLNPSIHSLAELARDEPAHHAVLDMPFAYYLIWTHTFSSAGDKSWRQGFPQAAQEKEYREVYDFASYLLKTYSHTGKTFYLGHWEGDGWLRGSVRLEDDVNVTPQAVEGMIDWLNTRQRAIDDAKRDTPHSGVEVWHYTEVNHVKLAMRGRKALVNEVLPHTPVDYVSYSSYDTERKPEELKAALSFIESKLTPKPGITGKRVWIGEYGFPTDQFSPAQQDAMARGVMRAGLEWGCPFILYWEMFNNEVQDGRQRGFWLIDNAGAKQPIYYTHQQMLTWAREYVSSFNRSHQRVPTPEEYGKAALSFLNALPPTPEK